jgi:hypothetical protein
VPRLILNATALLAVLACAGGAGVAGAESPAAPPSARPGTVLGLLYGGQTAELRRLDALTLRPRGRARLGALGPGMHVFSPDRRTLLLASGEAPRLRFIDVAGLRLQGSLDLPGRGWPSEFLWRTSTRLTVLLQGAEPRLVTVDPQARRILGSQALPGITFAAEARAGRLAVLLAPSAGIGTARLAVLDGRQRARVVRLPGIRAGSERIEDSSDSAAVRWQNPGLAISPDGTRALIVPAGNRVAEVDLSSLKVRHHELSQPISLLGRLRNWLEPPAEAKVVEGPSRFARWLGDHHVAVTGVDQHGIKQGRWDVKHVGLRVIDVRNWSVRGRAEHVSSILRARNVLLAYGGDWPEGTPGTGLHGYGTDAEERFHLLETTPIAWVETSWPYAYTVRVGNRQRDVIDLRSGQLLRTITVRSTVAVLGP